MLAHRPFQKQLDSLWLQFSVSRRSSVRLSRQPAPYPALEPEDETPPTGRAPVYRCIDGDVYRKSAGGLTKSGQHRDFRAGKRFSADYHQKSSGKTPNNGLDCPIPGSHERRHRVTNGASGASYNHRPIRPYILPTVDIVKRDRAA
jgi:hypothetical protein